VSIASIRKGLDAMRSGEAVKVIVTPD